MAPKRPTPMEKPPAVSSSEEEEETSSGGEEEEGSSSSEEETEGQPKKPSSPPPQTSKPAPKKPDSTAQQVDSESDSESESDSDSESDTEKPTPPDSTVKPIASKPMEEPVPTTKKPRSKPSKASSAVAKSITAKRSSEIDRDLKDSKRAKKKDMETDGVGVKSEDTKKQLFQRLWSEDDEIAVLKGMIDFTAKKGYDPSKDMTAFHEFIKKSLHIDVSLSQFRDKVSRLKKKFEKNVNRGKKGEDKTFAKSHEQKGFDLSKKIWGSERPSGGAESGVKSNVKARKTGNDNPRGNGKSLALKAKLDMDAAKENDGDKVDLIERNLGLKETVKFDYGVGLVGLENYVVQRGLDLVVGAKKAEMEDKWRKLHVAELELFLKRNELIREQAQLMLAAYKTEEH